MKYLMPGGFFLAATLHLAAQSNTVYTLESALETAYKNRREVNIANLEVNSAKTAGQLWRAEALPQISANADFRVNTQLQKSVIPIGQFGLPNTPEDATRSIAFGVPFQNLAGIDLTQQVYSPDRKIRRNLNDLSVQQGETRVEVQKNQVRSEVRAAFAALVFEQEKQKLAQQRLERNKVQLETAKTRAQQGAALPDELRAAQIAVEDAENLIRQTAISIERARRTLAYRMALDENELPAVQDNVENLVTKLSANSSNRPTERPEIRAEQLQQQSDALEADKALAQKKPVLSAYANFSVLALNDEVSTFNFIGLRAALPIYDGKQANIRAADARIRQQISAENLQKLQRDFQFAAQEASLQMQQARLEAARQQQNLALAQERFGIEQVRLRQGAAMPETLKNAEFSVQNAADAYLQSVYQLLSAALAYRVAVGD